MKNIARFCVASTGWFIAFDALAEIADKVPSVPTLWLLSVVLVVLAVLLGLFRPWAALIPGILALGGTWSFLRDAQDAAFMDAIRNELGPSYIWHELSASVLAVLVSVAVFALSARRKRTRRIDA